MSNLKIEETRITGVAGVHWRVEAWTSDGKYAQPPVEFTGRELAVAYWETLDEKAKARDG